MNDNPTRSRILEAGIKLFSRYGYMKTSLEDIAREAGIAKATIYYYFPSKEETFLAAFRDKAQELFEVLERQIAEAQTFEEKLSRLLRLPMKYIFENMPILAEALRQIPPNYLQSLEDSRLEYHDRMLRLFREIMLFGQERSLLAESLDAERICEVINDWFLLGDSCFYNNDKDLIVQRIERDHDTVISLLLYGIIKRTR